ncbi:hypothetical protein CHU98_g10723 [Xylaria longipes]|nr:hypothetical protein CHU98_g10723 [Xylaria longipes]
MHKRVEPYADASHVHAARVHLHGRKSRTLTQAAQPQTPAQARAGKKRSTAGAFEAIGIRAEEGFEEDGFVD